MSLFEFNSYLLGYQHKLIDDRCTAVVSGYYAAYYANSKRPKPLGVVIESLLKEKLTTGKKHSAPDVNIDAFECLEKTFKEAGMSG